MKKFLALLLAVLMLASVLVACGDNNKKSSDSSGEATVEIEDGAKLLVWAPDKAIDLTKELCEEFKKEHSDKNITIDVQVQSESEAATQALNDKDAAADVFGFASDQFNKLMTANALAPVFAPDDIKSRNSEASVKAATGEDGALYAFPETDDNGYFLVYDKSIIKIADKFFSDAEVNQLSVVAPNVTLSVIRDFEVVEKKEVRMPEELIGIVKCDNHKCITNNEPMLTRFHFLGKERGTLQCHYCNREINLSDVKLAKG